MKNLAGYSNYELHPVIRIKGSNTEAFSGDKGIIKAVNDKIQMLERSRQKSGWLVAFDIYPGVNKKRILELASQLKPVLLIDVEQAAKPEPERYKEFDEYITDDRVFGYMCHRKIGDLYSVSGIKGIREKIKESENRGIVVLVGFGTALFADADIHIFCDISRWEIQLRYRSGMPNWNCSNTDAPILTKYKIGFFIEWRIADRYKKTQFPKMDFIIDANDDNTLKMVSRETFYHALRQITKRPFRLEPYFDPGVWGGKWMQNMLGVGRDKKNLAWCFDGVPEENAINLAIGDITLKLPAMDLVLLYPRELLGDRVHGRYGAEYPIRFDFLDTMGGENLSLQVHPLTEYIQNEFGMHYTQDESYYILDTDGDNSYVYLGLKKNVDRKKMADDLMKAEKGEEEFPAEKYINKVPVKKHDHVLIPAGTVHCSGAGCMVLEISATPYIFTFKLWDWGRVGMDGLPRPIHLNHGLKTIQWYEDTDYVMRELVHQEKLIEKKDGVLIEKTGLHDREPIDVIRYTLNKPTDVECDDSVIQGNLVEGREARLESIDGKFEPFTVHYAETFIVPANAKSFRIVPDDTVIKIVLASIRR